MHSLFCTTRLITCGLVFLAFSPAAPAATITVKMANYFFDPTNSTISPGDTILWTNTTVTFHDTRYRSNSINFLWQSSQIPLGGTFSFTFTNTGFYPYYCFTHRLDHPEHTGTVSVVTAPVNPPSAVTILSPALNGSAFSFSFATQAGYNYSGQFTPSLNPTNWSAFTNVAGNGSVMQFTDSSLTNSTRYYRVVAQ